MKRFIAGFISAALLFAALPVVADMEEYILHKATYKIMVNGQKCSDAEFPTLNYNGATYVPLKKVADLLGVAMKWNADKGQAEIARAEVMPTPAAEATPAPTAEEGFISFSYDGFPCYEAYKKDGKIFNVEVR